MSITTNTATNTPADVLRKVRRIQLKTSHRVNELLTGSWHSAFKGRGIEFEEVRPYQIGDDVRAIDWNVTARSHVPFVKLFREERELAVTLLVDISPSIDFGTQHQSKRDLVTELSATLAMSAIKNNDKVGMTLFSDRIETHVPPRTGSHHVLRLIRELLYTDPVGTRTDPMAVMDHFNHTTRRRSVVFWISDFLWDETDKMTERSMRVIGRRHDLVPIVVSDARESQLPNVGLVRLRDCESRQVRMIDTSSRRVRSAYAALASRRQAERAAMFSRLNWHPVYLKTGQDIAEPLRRYFHQREQHQR